jgi:hypothetical protein
VADTLSLLEDPVGKYLTSPTHPQSTIGEVIEIDVLAAQFFRDDATIQDQLLAIVGERQLLTDMTLFPMAQDIAQSIVA